MSCAGVPPAGVDRIREIAINNEAVPAELDGYRIVFVSDIHFKNNFSRERLEILIDAINASKPDCIILGGDHTLGTREINEFAEAASRLSAPDGVYAVIGNHDFYNGRKQSIQTLRNAGIVVLEESLIITPRNIVIAGFGDFNDVFPVLKYFHEIIDKDRFTVLATHNPYYAEYADISLFDVMLAGHTHGGQITFFSYAPMLGRGTGQKYRTGTVYKDGVPVVISNGAGYGGSGILRFRLGAPSDFLLITLQSNGPM
ncbi:metallophosphoesterase [Brucepastera parasyntrophica]|uniref:metallophosphoesterase n=1 Tax=Brucepastera parasyntrophica TaxID=2880008 RepID=UPI002109B2C0|nr:metallophosphoesterase [Brucepastera parasyntrophica]ULQ59590.1 metallophosphoesterase [Brucepastera parasyntrophica]